MVFIVHGKLESIGEDRIPISLSEGDACGEELLKWYLEQFAESKGIARVILVQFNIWPIDIYPVTQDEQIPSRTLMSLSMLCGVPINCLYGYSVTDNVGSAIKHSTLHLGSIVVSGRRVEYTIITMRITYDTLHNFLYSILIAGQSGISITPNIHTYV
ncbi:hypothetical protein KIW84_013422 [Lathyrus oleraceus]|uniref:Uncharacterized protein n=1 Tax=Pisum sativum TaxID=3888 RepID=A0A9D5GXQ3_PEA|nr:hypothetical protein KIW84_013422 [Pisum sativum]